MHAATARAGKRAIAAVLLSGSVLDCTRPVSASAPAPRASSTSAADSAREFSRRLVERLHLPGFAITVMRGDTVLLQDGFGFADLTTKIKASSETKFRVGSVSKLYTAALLMRLVEQNCVELDAPVSRHLKLPPQLASVTLRQLSGHLAGVRHYRGAEFLTTTRYATLRDALAVFENDSLVASPGARYAYSSYGYNLIGAVLESACGSSYPELLRRFVLAPLGMRSTGPDVGAETPGRAQLYSVDSLGVTSAPPDNLSGRWPSGGLLSSTVDLARLGLSMLADGFLTRQSLQLMVTPQRLANNTSTAVGIGWRIRADSSGTYWHHGGSSNGGAAFLLVYPNEKLIVSMASNAFAAWGERDAVEVARLFLHSGHAGKAVERHASPKPKHQSAANSRRERTL